MTLIDPQKLFEKLMERRNEIDRNLGLRLEGIGEAALLGQEISDSQRTSVSDYRARIDEINRTVATMQRIVRESE